MMGVWLFVSAFWLVDASQAAWNVGVSGAAVFVLGLWSGLACDEGAAAY